MQSDFIPQYTPVFSEASLNTELVFYIHSKAWITEYKKTEEFENQLKEFLGVKHCIAVSNGTISLSLALLALGIKPGDEVLVPNLSMIATANAVSFIGAIPIFVDIDKRNLCMDLEEAYKHLSNKTKALIYVTFNGRSNDPSLTEEFCRQYNLKYISDDAQSLGSRYEDTSYIGMRGDISSFSFSVPKIITMGQGGCLVTNNNELAKKLRYLKDFGRDSGGNDIHNEFGINSKITDLQAIVGLDQLNDIEKRIEFKKDLFHKYFTKLFKIKEIEFIDVDLTTYTPWFIEIFCDKRDELLWYLKENNVGTRKIYSPMSKQLCYKNHFQHKEVFHNTEEVSSRGVWLPSSFNLTKIDIEYICLKIEEFFNGR